MSGKIIKKKKNSSGDFAGNSATYGVVGSIGDNYVVKDTPCLMPKENMKNFNQMRSAAQKSSFGDYPNPFNAFWKGRK